MLERSAGQRCFLDQFIGFVVVGKPGLLGVPMKFLPERTLGESFGCRCRRAGSGVRAEDSHGFRGVLPKGAKSCEFSWPAFLTTHRNPNRKRGMDCDLSLPFDSSLYRRMTRIVKQGNSLFIPRLRFLMLRAVFFVGKRP